MFECIGVLFFLTVSMGIVRLAFQIGELKQTTINLLGEIEMKQAEFDRKVDAVAEKIDSLGPKLDSESGEIAVIVAGYKDEIQRLKDSQGDNIDTSRLDALSSQLDGVGTRIGGLVDPLPTATTEELPANPIPDPVEVVDEAPTETTEVAEFPTEENQNESSDETATETETATENSDTEAVEDETSSSDKSEDEK